MIVGSIAIMGVVASLFLSFLKDKYGSLNSWKSKLALVAIALILSGAYQILEKTGWLATAVSILMVASTVYAFILKEESSN